MVQWYVFAIISAIFLGIAEILRKKALLKEHAMEFAAVYKIFELAIIIFLIPFVGVHLRISAETFILVYAISLIGTLAYLISTKSLRHTPISSVIPLSNIEPLFIVILAFIFLGEQISFLQFAGILALAAGVYALQVDHKLSDFKTPFKKIYESKYTRMFILAVLLTAVGSLGEKYVIGSTDAITLLFLIYLFTAINFTVLLAMFHDGFKGIKHGIKNAGASIFLVAFFATLSNLAYFKALSIAWVSLLIPIYRTGTIIATIAGGRFFKEEHLLQKSIACAIMTAGAVLVILG